MVPSFHFFLRVVGLRKLPCESQPLGCLGTKAHGLKNCAIKYWLPVALNVAQLKDLPQPLLVWIVAEKGSLIVCWPWIPPLSSQISLRNWGYLGFVKGGFRTTHSALFKAVTHHWTNCPLAYANPALKRTHCNMFWCFSLRGDGNWRDVRSCHVTPKYLKCLFSLGQQFVLGICEWKYPV